MEEMTKCKVCGNEHWNHEPHRFETKATDLQKGVDTTKRPDRSNVVVKEQIPDRPVVSVDEACKPGIESKSVLKREAIQGFDRTQKELMRRKK